MLQKPIIFSENDGGWDFKAAVKQREKDLQVAMANFFGPPNILSLEEQIVSRCKLGWINEGGKEYMTYIDSENLLPYKAHDDHYNNDGPVLPLVKIENATFVRWAFSTMEAQSQGF